MANGGTSIGVNHKDPGGEPMPSVALPTPMRGLRKNRVSLIRNHTCTLPR